MHRAEQMSLRVLNLTRKKTATVDNGVQCNKSGDSFNTGVKIPGLSPSFASY